VSEDPYVDPDTGVLVNRLGITNAGDLQLVETNHAFARDSQLQEHRLDGNHDVAQGQLVAHTTHYLGEVNAAHPFRDGNGRTQRAFFRQLLCDAGWSLRWSEVTPEENAHASEASLNGDNGPLEALLRRAITPLPAD
jgi:cell filamentation protein